MGTAQRREREREGVRRKILDAARTLFASEGYDAVSMRKIADAIEYSPTAIYVHFKDKADLMRELCKVDFGEMNAGWAQLATIPDPVERIRQLGLGYIRFATRQPNHFRLMFMTKPTPEMMAMTEADLCERGQGDPNRDGYALLKKCVEEAIDNRLFRPELTDPHAVTQLLWAGVHGVASLHITRPDHDPWCPWLGADRLGAEMVDLILRGVRRDASAKPVSRRPAKRTVQKGARP
jgi:AcrR family transcriptional regulator